MASLNSARAGGGPSSFSASIRGSRDRSLLEGELGQPTETPNRTDFASHNWAGFQHRRPKD
jgi:hypothetical protein